MHMLLLSTILAAWGSGPAPLTAAGAAGPMIPAGHFPETAEPSGRDLRRQEQAPGSVYRVLFLRAAPGHLTELIDLYRDRIAVLVAAGEARPVFMRHSQGDQWDLMLLFPVAGLEEYFSAARARRLARSAGDGLAGARFEARLRAITAWREELFVDGPTADTVAVRNRDAGFYHVEVFRALPGRYDDLVEQRRMENAYYHATRRAGNLIFTRLAGASWDTFTIGFYGDIEEFAATPDLPPEVFERAAREAGFESRGTIGTYLRSLIDEHHDTLATRVE